MKKSKIIEYLFEDVTFTSDTIIVIARDFNHFNQFINYYYGSPRCSIYRIYDSYFKWWRQGNKFIPFELFKETHDTLIITTKDFSKKHLIFL